MKPNRQGRAPSGGHNMASTQTSFQKTISFLLVASCLASLSLAQTPQTLASSSGAPSGLTATTSLVSTISETATGAPPESNTKTPTAASESENEPLTTIVDSIGVESDKADKSTGALDNEETNDEPTGGGIEPKSISHAASDNSVGESGKLTINDSAVAPDSPNDEEADEELVGSEKSSRQFNASSGAPVRLNMSHIDEVYATGVKDEATTVRTWNELQRKLKRGIGSMIGAIVPMALNMSQEAKISSNCSGAMLKWVLSMNQLKAWSLRMLDASGKPIAGLLEGSMTMFGNYRQCLKVRAPDDDEIEFAGEFREYFRGKYCIIQLKPWLPQKDRFYNLNTKLSSLAVESEDSSEWYDRTIFEELSEWLLAFNFVNIRYDLCVPSVCSREDIQKAVNYLFKGLDMKARVARCETDSPEGKMGFAAQVETGSAEVYEALAGGGAPGTVLASNASLIERLTLGSFSQLGWLILPLVAVVLVSLATLLALTINEDERQEQEDEEVGKRGKLHRTIKSLSLKRSMKSHLSVDYEQLADDKPLALYGIRFILILWVILVESAVNLKFEYLRELMVLKDLIFWWPMQFIINSTMQYDSFILLTAFTMAYKNCLNDGLRNAKALTRFVLDKYIRLMPSIMVMVALVIVLPLAYRGPVWNDYVTKQSAVCQSTGWLNAVFLQNYLPYNEMCLPHTWLLCVELQLVLIMAPLVYYLNKSYASNFGGWRSSMCLSASTEQVKKQQANGKAAEALSSSPATDSSRPFHWLWTTPGALLFGCIALGLASSFYNVYYRELPPSWFYTMADPDSKALYFGEHMTKLWTHLAVFAMGILAGVECRRASRRLYQQQQQRSLAGYRNSNIDFMLASQSNRLVSGPHKSHSSSSSSLPALGNAFNGSSQLDSISSKLASSDTCASSHHHQQQQQPNGSSVSIHMGAGRLASSTAGSEIGCLRSAASSEMVSEASGGCCARLLDLAGFAVAITIMGALIFSTHDWSLNELPRPLVAGLFDASSRLLWSLAMIWILYKVSVPTSVPSALSAGGSEFSLLARLLGHPLMVSLGKLSFLIYIIHPFVHTTVLAIQEQPIYSSWLMLFHILIGNMTITVILAALVSLFVEMPCRNLFRRCGTSLLLTQTLDGPGTMGASSAAATAAAAATTVRPSREPVQ